MSLSNSQESSAKSKTKPDYYLKVDEQVSKFLELHHKLTFFVITAAVGTLAFTFNFAITHSVDALAGRLGIILLLLAGVTSLSSAGSSLLALTFDISSIRKHLKYRYKHKNYDELNEDERADWEKVNSEAAKYRKIALFALAATVLFQAAFIFNAIVKKGGTL